MPAGGLAKQFPSFLALVSPPGELTVPNHLILVHPSTPSLLMLCCPQHSGSPKPIEVACQALGGPRVVDERSWCVPEARARSEPQRNTHEPHTDARPSHPPVYRRSFLPVVGSPHLMYRPHGSVVRMPITYSATISASLLPNHHHGQHPQRFVGPRCRLGLRQQSGGTAERPARWIEPSKLMSPLPPHVPAPRTTATNASDYPEWSFIGLPQVAAL